MKMMRLSQLPILVYSVMAIGIMVTIFCFSQQPAEESTELSKTVLDGVKDNGLEVFIPVISLGGGDKGLPKFRLEGRKWAHFYLYALLGVVGFLWWERFLAVRGSGRFASSLKRLPLGAALAFLSCLLYACTDEFHQLFVDGRSGQALDLLYDSSGFGLGITAALTAAAVVFALLYTRRARKNRTLGG